MKIFQLNFSTYSVIIFYNWLIENGFLIKLFAPDIKNVSTINLQSSELWPNIKQSLYF